MSQYPYRVKKMRTLSTVLAGGDERDTLLEQHHQLCIWRVSDREFRVVRQATSTGTPLAVSHDSVSVCSIDITHVRDWHCYRPGELMPWPEATEPPTVIDSTEKMLGELTKPAATKGAPATKAARA